MSVFGNLAISAAAAIRGGQCAAYPCREVVGAQSLGGQAREAKRAAQSQGSRRSQACRHSAPSVDRRYRIQMVIKGGCRSACIKDSEFPPTSGRECPCRDAGVGEIAPGFAVLERAKRASHIDPPASSYAIMPRARPYRGENHGPGKDVQGELDLTPGIREQPGSISEVPSLSRY